MKKFFCLFSFMFLCLFPAMAGSVSIFSLRTGDVLCMLKIGDTTYFNNPPARKNYYVTEKNYIKIVEIIQVDKELFKLVYAEYKKDDDADFVRYVTIYIPICEDITIQRGEIVSTGVVSWYDLNVLVIWENVSNEMTEIIKSIKSQWDYHMEQQQ